MKHTLGLCCLLAFMGVPSRTNAGDWPMWRYDAARSASTPHELASDLYLQWTRELPAPGPAWPESQFKLQFDAVYQPIVAGGRMFVGSTVDDTVAAYSTKTGEELWRTYTDGPVRFAPAVWNGRVYAVSDDGHLYCLNAESGEPIWTYNGGPQQRPIIGNGRLISTWPARGGVVVHEGVAYFTAGIWPSMGVFIHAVDATTGERLWINSDTSHRFVTHPHGADSFGSITPQGALAVSGENLIVPGGRTLPGVFDRRTGELKHFNFGGKGSGGHAVMVAGPLHFVRNQAFRTEDGAEIGSMFASLVAEGQIVGTEAAGKSVVATSVAGEYQDVEVTDRRGNKSIRSVFRPESVQRFTPSLPGEIVLRAGRHLYVAAGEQVAAYDFSEALGTRGEVAPVWTAAVDGQAASMLAADDRLYVVTDQARIHCFGPEPNEPLSHGLRVGEPAAAADGPLQDRVREVLGFAPLAGGYAVSLDAAAADLLMELVRQSEFQVVAVDADAQRIDALRQTASAAGMYGPRLSAHVGSLFEDNFPPYLADLVLRTEDVEYTAAQLQTIFNTLRPYGGVACLKTSAAQHHAVASLIDEAALEQASVERVGDWTVVRRFGALPDAGLWTHQYGDASNSVVSAEGRVKAPMGVLWFGGPANDKVLPRHGHGPTPQVAGGRLFIEGPDMLRCVDVYSGRVWWERDLPGVGAYYDNTAHHPGAGEIGSNYVSLADHVYVVYGTELLELDAQTGETTKQFALPDADRERQAGAHWGGLAVSGDVLVVTASPLKVKGLTYSKEAKIPTGARAVVKPHATWRMMAGEDAPDDWTTPDFDDGHWLTGAAGFGFGDDDDRTELNEMRGKFERVYIRTTFDRALTDDAEKLTLMMNFDDAFIAYLNGREIARVNIGKGRGANARLTGSHEAEGYEPFEIKDFRSLLKPGKNVLAVEGHNAGRTSSDFSLDPYLIAAPPQGAGDQPRLAEFLEPTRYATSSRQLVAFDRHTGEALWSREAEFSFRHNAVCLSEDTVFCIDGMSPQALAHLRRRGVSAASDPQLLALDLQTGDVRWSTQEDVFGTFLSYSAEHDVLVQGGSAFRDRAKDEVDRGLIAYRCADGTVLWERLDLSYAGPCLLWKDRIITNGNGGFELELLTGEETGWDYRRMYGCNTAIGCQTMLTFRSGAAGFFDLENNSGTGNLGGFRSSCTSNLIPADGVLSAPDYTRTCACAYQLQTSLAFVHMEQADSWTFNPADAIRTPLRAVGLNLGAPGDRRDSDGVLWLDYPAVGGPSPELSVTTEPAEPEWFAQHSSLVGESDDAWIAGSGARSIRSLKWDVSGLVAPGTYRVRLMFAPHGDEKSNDREMRISLQQEPRDPVDFAEHAVGASNIIVRDIPAVSVDHVLELTLTPARDAGQTGLSLCGIALIAE